MISVTETLSKITPTAETTPPALLVELRAKFSVLAEFRPLKRGVHRDLRAAMNGVSGVKISKAILCHINHGRYLEALSAGGPRYDLDGSEAGTVSPQERKRAAARLKRRDSEPDRLAMRLVRKITDAAAKPCPNKNPREDGVSDLMETRP